MLSLRPSKETDGRNEKFVELHRKGGEGNVAWAKRAIAETNPRDERLLCLIGGVDPVGFRLRFAQSHARIDLTPSHWSHCGVLLGGETLVHVPLGWPAGESPVPTNGVCREPFSRFDDPVLYPNVAVLTIPATADAIAEHAPDFDALIGRFQRSRDRIDCVELIVAWLGFAWGVGSLKNPLLEGLGIPSAVFVESVLAEAGVDVTPGLNDRAACPEAIWQAAIWWQRHYEERAGSPPVGRWCIGDRIAPRQPNR